MEKINKNDIRKISYMFRGLASDVSISHYTEQKENLKLFIDYIDNTPILREFIDSVHQDVPWLENKIEECIGSYGNATFDLKGTIKEKINILYQTCKIILEEDIPTVDLGWCYCHENNYNDMAAAFGERIVIPLARYIERLLIKDIMYEMGMEDTKIFNISCENGGQVNVAIDGSEITATVNNKNEERIKELMKVLDEFSSNIAQIKDNDTRETLNNNVQIIKKELKKNNPNKSMIKDILNLMTLAKSSICAIPELITGLDCIKNLVSNLF